MALMGPLTAMAVLLGDLILFLLETTMEVLVVLQHSMVVVALTVLEMDTPVPLEEEEMVVPEVDQEVGLLRVLVVATPVLESLEVGVELEVEEDLEGEVVQVEEVELAVEEELQAEVVPLGGVVLLVQLMAIVGQALVAPQGE